MDSRQLWKVLKTPGGATSQVRDVWAHFRNAFRQDSYARIYRTVRPYTMSGNARLHGLYEAVGSVARRGIDGDIVECGTARGGSAALLGLTMKEHRLDRLLWIFDTFEGIPPPTTADPDFEMAANYTGHFRGELPEVAGLLGRLGLLTQSRLVQGRFEDTLPTSEVRTISVLHIDGDWYHSVRTCLEHLFDRVSPGGIIQIDDYGHWEGARKAVDEFLVERRVREPLRYVDYTGRQLVKP